MTSIVKKVCRKKRIWENIKMNSKKIQNYSNSGETLSK